MVFKTLLKNFAQKVSGIGASSSGNGGYSREMEMKFEAIELNQFPTKVVKFSSQYNDTGVPLDDDTVAIPAWAAKNVCKGISSYPHYGDRYVLEEFRKLCVIPNLYRAIFVVDV